jgi:acetyl-CoA acetyltransferase
VARNPIKDQVAIVGAGATDFRRDAGRSSTALAAEAAVKAIRDAGLGAADIDGISAATETGAPREHQMASLLGLHEVTHYTRSSPVAGFPFIDAMNSVFSGSCDHVLFFHSVMRTGWASRGSLNDPFRRALSAGPPSIPESVAQATGYTAWASRYIHEYDAKREHFGYVAVNGRSNAVENPRAVLRDPITMEDYLSARMIREPLCMLDMDIPVDGAIALVLTTAERARDLPRKPVLVHAATTGLVDRNEEEQLPDLDHHGQQVVVRSLREKSDLWLDDVDVYFPYDGFSIITLAWFENVGYCGRGEAGPFLEDNWDAEANRVLINGKVPVNTHGGSLSEGATRGSGHFYEAVMQLRGDAGSLQVPGAKTALVTPGGFFFNSQGAVLRTD